MKAILFPFLFSLAVAAPAADVERRAAPSVTLPSATVVGSSFGGIDSFKGIPFAQPPTGQLRLKPPQPITSNLGTVVSQDIPKSCPQFLISTGSFPASVIGLLSNTPFFQTITNAGEDCLTINVQRPSGAKKGDKLPVLFWIFGGGFELGSTVMYDGSSIISNSIDKGQPIIFVAVNYRVGGFGFLGGKEILKDGSANLGLLDQRLGLQWVADNIEEFGGDPTKVTIWGESAGSISVLNQLVLYGGDHTYKGKPLFRGAIMNSGTSIPSNPVDSPKAQAVYDQVVKNAGCSGSSSTLSCLRTADYTKLLNAVNSVPGIFDYPSLMLSYFPRPDGTALPDSPDALIQAGRYAKVPFIVGNQEDEGTLFALVQSNLTTTDALVDYFSTLYFNNASRSQVQQLVANYPQDASAGSPYNTGPLYNIYPQYKRLAAILGDLVFILPRRGTLQSVGSTVPTWSYLSSYLYGTPILGTVHGSDILFEFGIVPGFVKNSIQTYYINFVNNLDPNEGSGGAGIINWPQWNAGKQLLNFQALSNRLITDDFRPKAYEFLVANLNSLRV